MEGKGCELKVADLREYQLLKRKKAVVAYNSLVVAGVGLGLRLTLEGLRFVCLLEKTRIVKPGLVIREISF